jgi:class 3 adenylate cyclase
MGLKGDLIAQCDAIFPIAWKERDGTVVPDETSLTFSNDGINLEGAVLYADLAGSTDLVDTYNKYFAAEIYKAFLYCCARIIKSCGGEVTAYDGDRVMAVFLGDRRSAAAKAALRINWAVRNIIQPRMKAHYVNVAYEIRHTCGIDHSPMMVAKTGARGANDLVWVGRAANHAAKLTELKEYATWITAEVYDRLSDESKYGGEPVRDMWTERTWTEMDGQRIYCSDWWWEFL